MILRLFTLRTANVTQLKILRSLNDLPEGIYNQFDQLSFIAYKGTGKGKIAFTSEDLLKIGIAENEMCDLHCRSTSDCPHYLSVSSQDIARVLHNMVHL